MSPENSPMHIQSVDELRRFPANVLDMKMPWNYRLSGGCVGVFVRPIVFLLGGGRYLKDLRGGQKEELKELLSIVGDEERWSGLNTLEQLDLRIRASRLVEQFAINRVTSFKK